MTDPYLSEIALIRQEQAEQDALDAWWMQREHNFARRRAHRQLEREIHGRV